MNLPAAVPVEQAVRDLAGVGLPPWDGEWERLARRTALKRSSDGTFYVGNPLRGPFLNALVRGRAARNILEIGTGRGYSAAAMAQALDEAGAHGSIWTVDVLGPEDRMEWPIDDGRPHVASLCREEVWERHLPPGVRNRIHFVHGDTARSLRRVAREAPPLDLVFIDAGHDYWSVLFDFLASVRMLKADGLVVLDDVGDRPGYGVSRLLERVVLPRGPDAVTVLDTHADAVRPSADAVDHRMAVVDLAKAPAAAWSRWHDGLRRRSYPPMQGLRSLARAVRH